MAAMWENPGSLTLILTLIFLNDTPQPREKNVSQWDMTNNKSYDLEEYCIYNSGGTVHWTYALCNIDVCLSSCHSINSWLIGP